MSQLTTVGFNSIFLPLHLPPLLMSHVPHQTGSDVDDAHENNDGYADERQKKSQLEVLILPPSQS